MLARTAAFPPCSGCKRVREAPSTRSACPIGVRRPGGSSSGGAARPRAASVRRAAPGDGGGGPGSEPSLPPESATALERFAFFARAGNPKEAWLSVSSSVLLLTAPAAALGALLHAAAWGGAPPPALAAAEAAAVAGAAAAAATELWKILEGFQG
ncbi:hypothetical protein Rsub_03614 [Raphidocelis subcapitata]|uniref:Uncharacterized protein n=1 Tax=Raphidocelis subcapitata TaxID=307507 RepID=A0A2V0NUH7_9CHLO|nr:hypothetical protein Rsub_03614 [Raphidocelis subcapitata]|eukprot:GBF91294.1 hypothetical protein Rsub_03614 [Raphidocelis subcapitata]